MSEDTAARWEIRCEPHFITPSMTYGLRYAPDGGWEPFGVDNGFIWYRRLNPGPVQTFENPTPVQAIDRLGLARVLTTSQMFVLRELAIKASKDNHDVFFSVQDIAAKSIMSEQSVANRLGDLCEEGWIEIAVPGVFHLHVSLWEEILERKLAEGKTVYDGSKLGEVLRPRSGGKAQGFNGPVKLLGFKLPAETHDAFQAYAKSKGGASHLLRECVQKMLEEAGAEPPEGPDTAAARNLRVQFRLSEQEMTALVEASFSRGVRPMTWARDCIITQTRDVPVMTDDESDGLRSLAVGVRGAVLLLKKIAAEARESGSEELYASAIAGADQLRDSLLDRLRDLIQRNMSYWRKV